ncbi:hypothetical protein FHR32_008543 [Streptosporangium album]|uniref:Uncharacterized protein n=1 Tax=Streptosporangium album TaxID=47479 RepID=A0A7W7S5A3_9ACTN|nr:hypothetical protein [Streptosporangium album]MBB4944140.1 hypothetical protein [Streptosporangium album]
MGVAAPGGTVTRDYKPGLMKVFSDAGGKVYGAYGERVFVGEVWLPTPARFARYLRPDGPRAAQGAGRRTPAPGSASRRDGSPSPPDLGRGGRGWDPRRCPPRPRA